MPKKNRSTLKRYFKEGALPTADQFSDFIDSTLNMVDEGFEKTDTNGLEISLLDDRENLFSFYRDRDPKNPIWSISLEQSQDKLLFNKIDADIVHPVMCFTNEGNVGVNKTNPECAFDVGGVIKSEGRIGVSLNKGKTVLADGEWHNITGALSGCQAFEIMAGTGNKGTGKYALMRAIAINTFNPQGFLFNFFNLKKRIKVHQAYYRSSRCKLKLRWKGNKDKYYLQIRSNCGYGKGIAIRCYITKLWFDEDMSDSKVSNENTDEVLDESCDY